MKKPLLHADDSPARLLTVLCDGVELRYCVWADPATGVAFCHRAVETRPGEWDVVRDQLTGEPLPEEHTGRITFRVLPGFRLLIEQSFAHLAPYLEPDV